MKGLAGLCESFCRIGSPGKFEGGKDGWEMEWVSSAVFFIYLHFIRRKLILPRLFLDWDNGLYEGLETLLYVIAFCAPF